MLVINFYRYFINEDYNIQLYIECNQTMEVCVTDGSDYYNKFLVKMNDFSDFCDRNADVICIEALMTKNKAEKLNCYDNLEPLESCVGEFNSPSVNLE